MSRGNISAWVAMWLAVLLAFSPAAGWSGPVCQDPPQPEEKEKKDERKKDETVKLTLKPERKIEFTTDEGTWLSLDVSPDGKTIIFELLGDLYTLPLAGGEATRITEGMPYDSMPRYSPDGKWIAFLSDRDGADNLWIARADGSSPRQLTREKRMAFSSPAWTPDSQYVLVNQGAQNIHMYHIYGGSGINLTGPAAPAAPGQPAPPGANVLRRGAAMSPDGRYLYYARKPGGQSVYNQMSFGWEIWRRDMETGAEDQITQAQRGAVRPLLSPDGKMMVYGARYEVDTGLRVRNLESGEDRWLIYPTQRDDMESASTRDLLPGYAFLPGGEELVVTFNGKINRVNLASGAAREIPFTAQVSLDLGPLLNFQRRVEEGPVRARLLQDPALSPDGKRLAFSAMASLWVMDVPEAGSAAPKPRRLTSSAAGEFKPAWSPDGRWIAYVTWSPEGVGHLWKVRSDGSGSPQQLTRVSAFYTDPVFSPDGQRIVARRGNAWMRAQTPSEFGGLRIPLDLVWIPAAGGDASLIVPARGLSTPHFAGDPGRIYFYSAQGLVSMRYDATDRRTHLRITGRPFQPQQQPPPAESAVLSPDGRWVLARVNNQIFVAAVPAIGDPVPVVNVFGGAVPVKQITDIGADAYSWAGEGKTIVWSVGTTVFRRALDSVDFDPEVEKKKEEARKEAEKKEQEEKQEAQKAEGEPEKKDEKKEEKKEPKKPREEDEGVTSFEVVLEFPRHAPEGSIVLRGATVITMKGDEVIPNADLVVTNNRIAAVGRRGTVAIPAGARIVDVRGAFITPGFIDTHAHYEMRTAGVLELYNWTFLANLAYGVTSGLDVQTSTNDYLTYFDLVEAGKMIGPRAYSTGPGVFANTDFQTYEAAKYVLEKYKRYYRNHNIKSYVVGNRQQRQWVVQASKELELTVTTEGALDLKLNMTHAIDGFGGNEHSLPIVPLYKDVVELFARSRTSYTPTLLVLYGGPWAENHFYQTTEVHDDPKLNRYTPHNELDLLTRRRPWFRHDEHSYPKTAAQAAKIQRAGGAIGVGAHGQLQGLGFHWEMWSLAAGGMTPREVLRAATIDGAWIIGLQQDLGSIEPGKLADLVILSRNPLDEIRNSNSVRMVMKNGELFDGDTMRQLWPVEREIPPFWWWTEKPPRQP